MVPDSDPASGSRGSPRKATLFCPDCGHRDPVDGDWVVRHRPDAVPARELFVCPDCGALVQNRPRYGAAESSRAPAR
jgi:predicted RNA-binding Zn-ribbon protein involved in translation (DUF1610 family)